MRPLGPWHAAQLTNGGKWCGRGGSEIGVQQQHDRSFQGRASSVGRRPERCWCAAAVAEVDGVDVGAVS